MLLNLEVRTQLKELAQKEFREPVTLKLFSQAIGCESCQTAEQLVNELKEVLTDVVGDKFKVEILSPFVDKEQTEKYGVDRVPTIVIEGDKDYGIRYVGLPAGLEFTTLINGIFHVSQRKPQLSEKTVEILQKIDLPIEIWVFVTQTCGYCPAAAVMSWDFALVNDNITAKVIDASENPDLAEQFQVVGVPKIVINKGMAEFVGAQPENAFLGYVVAVYEKMKREQEGEPG
ncbi:MAG: glutaredoxin [Aquificae bacterium]|nr:glutaredoxin [Aquificota bacterium]